MAEELRLPENGGREENYRALMPQLKSVLDGEPDYIANLANTAAVLRQALNFFWVGFYRMLDGELVLGPFQGDLACTRIPLSRGVCGACARERQTIIVPDVNRFPGHIACSSRSRSEIVVPLVVGGETKLVLDVDSEALDDFGPLDATYLEQVVDIIKRRHFL